MPALEDILRKECARIEAASLSRPLQEVDRQLISFGSNDYLGLSQHPQVKEAAIQAIRDYGTGAGASRLVTGNHALYKQLEEKLARYRGTEAALVFGSGYLTNMGIIPALVGKGDLIIADRLVHACLLDGARLSGARLIRFPHNKVEKCAELLALHRKDYQRCLIITDTIFSMDGDRAPLRELSALAKEYEGWLLTDDAHMVESSPPIADIHMGTLSKALGGYGGYVAASSTICKYLQNTARSFIYSTGLPPSVIASAITALDVIEKDKSLVREPHEHALYFTSLMGMTPAESQIVPVIYGEVEAALAASAGLRDEGFLVPAIRPPTVPQGTARLRIAFTARHERSDIERLAGVIRVLPGHH